MNLIKRINKKGSIGRDTKLGIKKKGPKEGDQIKGTKKKGSIGRETKIGIQNWDKKKDQKKRIKKKGINR